MKRHRHQEFLAFLKTIDRNTPQDLAIHCIVDNYATPTHKKEEVQRWRRRHPRFHFHFIPSSWLNLVERWFAQITSRRIRRGVFHSVAELEKAIMDYIEHHNPDPKPFAWTKSANDIVRKAKRGKAMLETLL
ncbi:MAG TPA: transposase [Candidatus Methylacidiphilales bacterium]|nr:transposase [Candidatus Methylacidiphilales bacterium]